MNTSRLHVHIKIVTKMKRIRWFCVCGFRFEQNNFSWFSEFHLSYGFWLSSSFGVHQDQIKYFINFLVANRSSVVCNGQSKWVDCKTYVFLCFPYGIRTKRVCRINRVVKIPRMHTSHMTFLLFIFDIGDEDIDTNHHFAVRRHQ